MLSLHQKEKDQVYSKISLGRPSNSSAHKVPWLLTPEGRETLSLVDVWAKFVSGSTCKGPEAGRHISFDPVSHHKDFK